MVSNKTLHPHDLTETLLKENATLVLDTGVFSTAVRSQSFTDFLSNLKKETKSALSTIEPVVFESIVGSSTTEVYNNRRRYVDELIDMVIPTDFLSDIDDFLVVMAKYNPNNRSFTDYLLAAVLYRYRHTKIFVMSSDLKAFPFFFTREYIVTTEEDGGYVKNFGVFSFNEALYVTAIKSLT